MVACPICGIPYEDPAQRICSRCGSDLRVKPSAEGADSWIGKIVDGRYRVLARIGTGGMGAVYRVEHVRMGKIAAMKVLHRDLASDEEAGKRFRREAEAVSRLTHPNVVQTFDFGFWEGLLFLIMEFVKGDDLGTMVKRDGAMAPSRALPLFVQVCNALEEAHQHGVIHRDLKPENIVCVRHGHEERAKVLDFGLAKLRERGSGSWEGPPSSVHFSKSRPRLGDSGEITGAGNLVGTPYYMSPEQVRSESVDQRSDLYSLGATLYRVVTGCYPFEGTSPVGIITRHITEDVVPPTRRVPERNLPSSIDRIISRSMARRREDRYVSAADMRRDIETALGARRRSSEEIRPLAASEEILPVEQLSLPDQDFDTEEADTLDRLSRADVDAFERYHRRQRRVRSILVTPLLLAGLGVAGWGAFKYMRPERPVSAEQEPNDDPTHAGLLPKARPVSGQYGGPRAGGDPDFDYFRIPGGQWRRAVTARLSGVPDLDLVLELYDAKGGHVARSDIGRVGQPERLGPVALNAGDGYIRVHPAWAHGQAAPSGSTAPYQLTVDWGSPSPDWELEPNDAPDLANRIDDQVPVSGYLPTAEDEDWYSVTLPAGMRLEGKIDGIEGVDLVVLVGSERKQLDSGGVGEDETFEVAPDKAGAVLLAIAEQAPRKAAKKPVEADRTEPYTLRLRFRPKR